MNDKVKMKIGVALFATVSFITPSLASHTECIVLKDTLSMNRPEASNPELRLVRLKKGETVSIRDAYHNWMFVLGTRYRYEFRGEELIQIPDSAYAEYGWVPRNML
jgi:hypothetical protein